MSASESRRRAIHLHRRGFGWGRDQQNQHLMYLLISICQLRSGSFLFRRTGKDGVSRQTHMGQEWGGTDLWTGRVTQGCCGRAAWQERPGLSLCCPTASPVAVSSIKSLWHGQDVHHFWEPQHVHGFKLQLALMQGSLPGLDMEDPLCQNRKGTGCSQETLWGSLKGSEVSPVTGKSWGMSYVSDPFSVSCSRTT